MQPDEDWQCILPRANEDGRSHRRMADALICQGHDLKLRQYLTELANYPAALVAAVHAETMSVKLSSVMVTGSSDERMPIGEERADHMLNIRNMLWAWSKYVADSRGVNRPDLSDVWVTARFLARHQLWLTSQDSVTRYHQGLRDIVSTGRGLLHPSKGPNRSQLPCPLTESEGCTGVLASLPTPDDDEQTNTACDCCGFILTPGQFRTYKRQLRKRLDPHAPDDAPDLVTEQDALWWAMATGWDITGAAIRKWASRGLIGRYERAGRTLYDLDELKGRLDARKAA